MTAVFPTTQEPEAAKQAQSTLNIILAITDGRVLIHLSVACKIAGISEQSWRNREAVGKPLPFPAPRSSVGVRRVHVRDLAAYIDSVSGPLAANASFPPALQSNYPNLKRGPGRPRNADRVLGHS
jgi:hypothetical protein